MRKVLPWTAGIWLSLGAMAWAHLCNNIYRTPDRIIVKPEKQVTTIERSDQFRVFVQNNYPTYLRNLRLTARADSPAVSVAVTPASIRQLKAGERSFFTVRVTVRPGTPRGRHALRFSISADNVGFRPVEEASIGALRKAARTGNPSHMVLAAESLVRRRDPMGMKVLTEMARGRDRDSRSRAIRALGKCGDRSHIAFLKGLLQERDGFIRGNVLLALGLLKAEAATFRAFFQDRDDFVRACAVAGLALAGDKSVLPWLRQALQKTRNIYIRIACGWGLAAHADRAGVEALDKAFTSTNEAIKRVMAGDALVDIATRAR